LFFSDTILLNPLLHQEAHSDGPVSQFKTLVWNIWNNHIRIMIQQ